MQMCNLSEINASNIESQDDFNDRAWAAAFIGTLQASYTDFHYLRDQWKYNCEKDALLGVSLTGIASMKVFDFNIEEAAKVTTDTNLCIAKKIGINKAARVTTVKPAGTTSLVLGTSSGIHAWHDKYYWRRMRLNKNESLYSHLLINHPELIEDDFYNPNTSAIIKVPQKAPDGSVTRSESALDLLNRVHTISEQWVKPGYRTGFNTHNVSCTVSIRKDEWDEVRDWMWINRFIYSGISVLPFDDHTYVQAPFETCTKEDYENTIEILKTVNLIDVREITDETSLMDQASCAGNNCEIV